MSKRFISFPSVASMATTAAAIALALSLTALPVGAQSAMPRTPDGHPDLQGTYDLATMTPFERMPGDPPVLSKEQADQLQQAEQARRNKNRDRVDPNDHVKVGGDTTRPSGKSFFEFLEKAGGGAVGGYDRLWLNQGKNYMEVDGQIRTSIVIDPPDGHLPPYNAAAKARRAGGRGLPTSDAGESNDVTRAEP